MISATLTEQTKAKLKFFAGYIVSVSLIMIILASLWQGDTASFGNGYVSSAEAVKLMETDAFLHQKMEELDNLYTSSLAVVDNQNSGNLNIASAETAFRTTLDSIEKETALSGRKHPKEEMNLLVANFRKIILNRSVLLNSSAQLLNDTYLSTNNIASDSFTTGNDAMQELKTVLEGKEEKLASLKKKSQTDLVEKDKIIASLQKQLSKRVGSTLDGEWKQKYAKLKTFYDNLRTENNALNKAFKTVVDDDRRLRNQLQSTRKQ
jgi:hypothetical protein